MTEKTKTERYIDEPECAGDLEQIQEWAGLAACHARQNVPGLERYRQILRDRGEGDERLEEIANWRRSTVFTEREKAAFLLSESMSLSPSEELPPSVLKVTKLHFNRTEMVRLTLAIVAVNEWINCHSGSRVRVLIVEDDPSDRELLLRQLRKAQIDDNVIFVPDARQALGVLEDYRNGKREGELIALFLDLHLPGLGGVEFLRKVRAMPDMVELPVIVITGSHDPRDFQECQRLKVLSYLEKPITFTTFSKAVASIFFEAVQP